MIYNTFLNSPKEFNEEIQKNNFHPLADTVPWKFFYNKLSYIYRYNIEIFPSFLPNQENDPLHHS